MLLDSAETLLSQRSIPEISYADIAQHAGLPLSSCYYFYSDKFDLLRALNNRLGAALRSELEDALPSGCVDSWQALIRRSVACIAGFAERHPCAVELWCSGNMPQAIHSETKQRDKALSLVFKESFLVHFSLPECDERDWDQVFHVAFEILDRVMALAFQPDADRPAMLEEAVTAVQAYLGAYLSSSLARRDVA